MSARARQLLLEVLLLRERYSNSDFRWVEEQLAEFPTGEEIRRISRLLRSKDPIQSTEKPPRKLVRTDVHEILKALIEDMRKAQAQGDDERILAIAQRLDLSIKLDHKVSLVDTIEHALRQMDDTTLRRFLGNMRIKRTADEGYVDLANYLISNKMQK